jgi:hypothetical protein
MYDLIFIISEILIDRLQKNTKDKVEKIELWVLVPFGLRALIFYTWYKLQQIHCMLEYSKHNLLLKKRLYKNTKIIVKINFTLGECYFTLGECYFTLGECYFTLGECYFTIGECYFTLGECYLSRNKRVREVFSCFCERLLGIITKMYIKYFSKSTFFYFPRISKSDQQRTH